jgi:hypothetical protein
MGLDETCGEAPKDNGLGSAWWHGAQDFNSQCLPIRCCSGLATLGRCYSALVGGYLRIWQGVCCECCAFGANSIHHVGDQGHS